MWSQRDVAIEDEVFSQGRFADTVFICAGSSPSNEVEEVYGQAALFALISPVLLDRLKFSTCSGAGGNAPASLATESVEDAARPGALGGLPRDRHGRQELYLADEITARGFREVARYVYRLAPRFTPLNISEVSMAARILQLPELDKAAYQWGLANLDRIARLRRLRAQRKAQNYVEVSESTEAAVEEGPHGAIGDALCFFGMMCSPIGDEVMSDLMKQDIVTQWREALLRAFDCADIGASTAFLELREGAMLLLLEIEEIHAKPALLWERCVRWAWLRKDREQPLAKATAWGALSFENPPKRLFAAGARLVTVSTPTPAEHDVDWQRWLLPVAERMRFQDMPPQAFAAHMEAMQPMLPELRRVIYRVRRQGTRLDVTQRLLMESR